MSSAAIALAVSLGAPALAQDQADSASVPVIAPPPPTADDAVGPAQLRDFSINGTVTRRAETPAATTPAQPSASQSATTGPAATRSPTPDRGAAGQVQTATADRAPASSATPPASTSSAFNFPPPTPASTQAPVFGPSTIPESTTGSAADPLSDPDAGLISAWPWLAALLAAAGAALWYFRRHRPDRHAFAGAGADASALEFRPPPVPTRSAPRPDPTPKPAPRQPVPAAAPKPAAAPVGIVSTRLRPWLEIDFEPGAAIVDNEKGAIQFEVTVYNSGSAPARDVLVEAAMFNAGPDQDQVIGQFFERPSSQGEGVTIPPLQRMSFRSLVSLPREQLRIFEVERRALFVPLIGFNATYRWSGGQGQTSASFLVGRNTNGEKMGPFRVDQGPKTFRGLASHEHTLRVRK